MARLIVKPLSRPLLGSVPVPADKSISHRALILAALAGGRSELRGFSYGEDNVATQRAFGQMGVSIEDDAHGTLRVHGVGLDGLSAPSADIDCGNSGTTMRLLSGVLAGQHFASRLVGDASLSRRPMGRIVKPLGLRGAVITGAPRSDGSGEITAPLEIGPLPAGRRLEPLEYQLPVASAQVKSALLLSGLWASAGFFKPADRRGSRSEGVCSRLARACAVSRPSLGAGGANGPGGHWPPFLASILSMSAARRAIRSCWPASHASRSLTSSRFRAPMTTTGLVSNF